MDAHNTRNSMSEADILECQSRPRPRSECDTLNHDFQAADTKSCQSGAIRRHSSRLTNQMDMAESSILEHAPSMVVTPVKAAKERMSRPNRKSKTSHDSAQPQSNRCLQLALYKRIEGPVGVEGATFEMMSLMVRLGFIANKAKLQDILSTPYRQSLAITPGGEANSRNRLQPTTPLRSSPHIPATSRTATNVYTTHILHTIDSVHKLPPFERRWVDETHPFDIKAALSKLRPVQNKVGDLGTNYRWYNDAVSVDAIFPPGILISAKEIMAFYPHHIRWKSVMLRLTYNDFRGPDMMGMQVCLDLSLICDKN